MAYLLQHLLTDAAARWPHRPAVAADDGPRTYQEPDERCGSRLRAVIVAGNAGALTRETVLDHCRHWLLGYMVPEVVEFCTELPRTSTGKVDRAELARDGERCSGGSGR